MDKQQAIPSCQYDTIQYDTLRYDTIQFSHMNHYTSCTMLKGLISDTTDTLTDNP